MWYDFQDIQVQVSSKVAFPYDVEIKSCNRFICKIDRLNEFIKKCLQVYFFILLTIVNIQIVFFNSQFIRYKNILKFRLHLHPPVSKFTLMIL